MRVFKRALIFILFNILIISGMQFALSMPSSYELAMEQYLVNDCDTLVMGTSYGFNLIPDLLPEGEKIHNLCGPTVPMVDDLYIIRQLQKEKGIKRIYYDIYLECWTGELGDVNRIPMLKLLSGRERTDYFLKVLTRESFTDFFFRYELESEAVSNIPQTIRTKLNVLTAPPAETPPHQNRAFLSAGQEGDYTLVPKAFSPQQVLPSATKAFEELARFCRQENIELIPYINAFPAERILSDNTQAVHEYFTAVCAEQGLPLYDMNYLKWEYLPRETTEYVDMDGHMKEALARRYTALFTEVITSQDSSLYFETSYEEVRKEIAVWQETLGPAA